MRSAYPGIFGTDEQLETAWDAGQEASHLDATCELATDDTIVRGTQSAITIHLLLTDVGALG